MTVTRRLRRGERGAVVVEAAFVLPILMMFILGLVDLGHWDFQKSQASSAARDGARTAIISAAAADTPTSSCSTCSTSGLSAANLRIRNAIGGRLGGQKFDYTVVCLPATGISTTPCVVSPSTVDRYRVRVTVTWDRPAMSFVGKWFGSSQTITGTSTMVLSG